MNFVFYEVMDKNYQVVSNSTKRIQQQQLQGEETLSEKDLNENFSQQAPLASQATPPKVTVSLPKHAASRLRDLVQRRDIALLRLGIISVQFEDDQIIPLTLNTTNYSIQTKQQSISPIESIMEPQIENQNTNSFGNQNTSSATPPQLQQQQEPSPKHIQIETSQPQQKATTSITTTTATTTITLAGLTSPNEPILESEELESNMNTSDSPILDQTIAVTTVTTEATSLPPKDNCNNLAVIYEDDDDDDKNENEVVSEVENQHSSYNIHQLSQLEFADPIELEMYDNDNLLFSDYTLNLS